MPTRNSPERQADPHILSTQPYAWEAREFVRKLLIGKPVKFQHEYSVDRLEREFGKVTTQSNQNLAELLIGEGLAEVRSQQQKTEVCEHPVTPSVSVFAL